MAIEVIGLDLGKRHVHLVAMDERGKVVQRRRLVRAAVVERLADLPPCLIGMEASCGAHHLFVKTNKNDGADAEAIGEAVQRPQMRFLGFQTGLGALAGNPRMPIRAAEPLDLQALEAEIATLDQQILTLARAHPGARLLMTIPGIGPLIASALARPWAAVAISPAGGAWRRASTPPATRPGCSASPNAGRGRC